MHTAIVYVQCTFLSVCTQALYGHARGEKDPVPLHLCLGCRLGLQSGADCCAAGMNGPPSETKFSDKSTVFKRQVTE